jgi:hypothetical protein
MGTPAQKRAVQNYRASLAERGLTRFEVVARETDRDLIKALAKRLVENGPEAESIRKAAGEARPENIYTPKRGGILEALRNSPLVGSGVKLTRSRKPWRTVEL